NVELGSIMAKYQGAGDSEGIHLEGGEQIELIVVNGNLASTGKRGRRLDDRQLASVEVQSRIIGVNVLYGAEAIRGRVENCQRTSEDSEDNYLGMVAAPVDHNRPA